MSNMTARYGFAFLCALGMLVIGFGAVLEIARFRRGAREGQEGLMNTFWGNGNMISLRQFRLRLLSAVLWMIILGALAYAVTVLWPDRGGTMAETQEQLRRFARVLGGAMFLILVAFALLIYDVMQLARERRVQTARFNRGLADMARSEAARLRELEEQPPDQRPPDPNSHSDRTQL